MAIKNTLLGGASEFVSGVNTSFSTDLNDTFSAVFFPGIPSSGLDGNRTISGSETISAHFEYDTLTIPVGQTLTVNEGVVLCAKNIVLEGTLTGQTSAGGAGGQHGGPAGSSPEGGQGGAGGTTKTVIVVCNNFSGAGTINGSGSVGVVGDACIIRTTNTVYENGAGGTAGGQAIVVGQTVSNTIAGAGSGGQLNDGSTGGTAADPSSAASKALSIISRTLVNTFLKLPAYNYRSSSGAGGGGGGAYLANTTHARVSGGGGGAGGRLSTAGGTGGNSGTGTSSGSGTANMAGGGGGGGGGAGGIVCVFVSQSCTFNGSINVAGGNGGNGGAGGTGVCTATGCVGFGGGGGGGGAGGIIFSLTNNTPSWSTVLTGGSGGTVGSTATAGTGAVSVASTAGTSGGAGVSLVYVA